MNRLNIMHTITGGSLGVSYALEKHRNKKLFNSLFRSIMKNTRARGEMLTIENNYYNKYTTDSFFDYIGKSYKIAIHNPMQACTS